VETVEKFIVKHYNGEAHPSIKGHGFDGTTLGDERYEADDFVEYINSMIELIDLLDSSYEITSGLIGNGCGHGFKPASNCKNKDCEDKRIHDLMNIIKSR
jgi:hypothetical protein